MRKAECSEDAEERGKDRMQHATAREHKCRENGVHYSYGMVLMKRQGKQKVQFPDEERKWLVVVRETVRNLYSQKMGVWRQPIVMQTRDVCVACDSPCASEHAIVCAGLALSHAHCMSIQSGPAVRESSILLSGEKQRL